MLEANLEAFMEKSPKIFNGRVSKGPPPEYRWFAWKLLSKSKSYILGGVYDDLLKNVQPGWEFDIKKDLDRTFPDHKFFNKETGHGDVG
jgi:hypothetical protein